MWMLLAIASSVYGQKLRLNSYGSYVFDGSYHIYYENGDYYKGIINPGLQLGFGMEYLVTPNYGVEFSNLRRYTHVFPEGDISSDRRSADLMFNYFLLGINAYPQTHSERLQAFGGASMGVIVQSASGTNSNIMTRSITKFAWAAKVGGIFWASSQVGVKLQAQWLSSLQFKNGIVNFDVHGIGNGPVAYTIANQLELGTGFIIKLGKPSDKN